MFSKKDPTTKLGQQLLSASKDGKASKVLEYIQRGAEINVVDSHGCTSLLRAASRGHLEAVVHLVDHDAELDKQDMLGVTALMAAAGCGYIQIVVVLVRQGAQLDVQDNQGNTALIKAAQAGYFDVADTLIDANADMSLTDNDNCNALMIAAQKGFTQVMQSLIQGGCALDEVDEYGKTALIRASGQGRVGAVELLVNAGANASQRVEGGVWSGKTAYDVAAIASGGRNKEMIQELLNVHQGHKDQVEAKAQLAPGTVGIKPTHQNLAKHAQRNPPSIERSQDRSQPVSTRSAASIGPAQVELQQSLLLAASTGRGQVVQQLLLDGTNVDAIDSTGRSAFMLACCGGHLNVVKLLHRAGADIHMVDVIGFNALVWAAERGHLNVVQYLAGSGVNANQRASGGKWRGKNAYDLAGVGAKNNNREAIQTYLRDVMKVNRTSGESIVVSQIVTQHSHGSRGHSVNSIHQSTDKSHSIGLHSTRSNYQLAEAPIAPSKLNPPRVSPQPTATHQTHPHNPPMQTPIRSNRISIDNQSHEALSFHSPRHADSAPDLSYTTQPTHTMPQPPVSQTQAPTPIDTLVSNQIPDKKGMLSPHLPPSEAPSLPSVQCSVAGTVPSAESLCATTPNTHTSSTSQPKAHHTAHQLPSSEQVSVCQDVDIPRLCAFIEAVRKSEGAEVMNVELSVGTPVVINDQHNVVTALGKYIHDNVNVKFYCSSAAFEREVFVYKRLKSAKTLPMLTFHKACSRNGFYSVSAARASESQHEDIGSDPAQVPCFIALPVTSSLQELLEEMAAEGENKLGESEVRLCADHILQCLIDLHNVGITHGDVSALNIAHQKTRLAGQYKLVNFLTWTISADRAQGLSQVPSSAIVRGAGSGMSDDVYALGRLCVRLLCGSELESDGQVHDRAQYMKAVGAQLNGVSEQFKGTIWAMIDPDASARPNALEARRMLLGEVRAVARQGALVENTMKGHVWNADILHRVMGSAPEPRTIQCVLTCITQQTNNTWFDLVNTRRQALKKWVSTTKRTLLMNSADTPEKQMAQMARLGAMEKLLYTLDETMGKHLQPQVQDSVVKGCMSANVIVWLQMAAHLPSDQYPGAAPILPLMFDDTTNSSVDQASNSREPCTVHGKPVFIIPASLLQSQIRAHVRLQVSDDARALLDPRRLLNALISSTDSSRQTITVPCTPVEGGSGAEAGSYTFVIECKQLLGDDGGSERGARPLVIVLQGQPVQDGDRPIRVPLEMWAMVSNATGAAAHATLYSEVQQHEMSEEKGAGDSAVKHGAVYMLNIFKPSS